MMFVFQPPINQKLVLRGAELLPTPSFDDIETVMCTCIDAIVEAAHNIQRVSTPQAHNMTYTYHTHTLSAAIAYIHKYMHTCRLSMCCFKT